MNYRYLNLSEQAHIQTFSRNRLQTRPLAAMWEGFLYIGASFRIDLETHPLTIPDKQPNKVGFTPLSIPTLIGTGREHAQSIYPKHPCPVIWGNQNPVQRKTCVGYIQKVLL